MSLTKLQEACNAHQSTPLGAEFYKNVGVLLNLCSQSERAQFFETFQPKEFHLQCLKVVLANISGFHAVLVDGLREESKEVSRYCVDSKVLYKSVSTSYIYDAKFVLPFLQAVSRSTRNRFVWNLGRHMPEGDVITADNLYSAISTAWGSKVALPLLCRASEELIQSEIVGAGTLSEFQLLTVAKRFPLLALLYLEKCPDKVPSLQAARFIVKETIPNSFDYCLTRSNKKLFSKSANKIILRDYRNVVLEVPHKWANVLNKKCVKFMLTDEEFKLFCVKQLMQVDQLYLPSVVIDYFNLLLPNQISDILKEVFQRQYNCHFVEKLDFWERNSELLCLLSDQERSAIAEKLDAKSDGSNRWVPLMTCDKSIPLLKAKLQFEANANMRASLVSGLLETVQVNKDTAALEEVCQFVAVRYRNDREVLYSFFSSIPDLSSVSSQTWSVVYGLATKFYVPDDWYTSNASKLFLASVKRNGISGLTIYLQHVMQNSTYFNVNDLKDLSEDLRAACIEEVFKKDNVENTDLRIQQCLNQFLPLLSKWNARLKSPVIWASVKSFIHNTLMSDELRTDNAIDFILDKRNGIDVQFIEQCFEESLNADVRILRFLLLKRSLILNSEKTAGKIGDVLVENRNKLFRSVKLLKKMKKAGYVDLLQYLVIQSKSAIADSTRLDCSNAVFLCSLTSANITDYFSIIDTFLADADNSEGLLSPFKEAATEADIQQDSVKAAKRQESIYKGIGLSFSHIDIPTGTVDRLVKFCVNGDLVLYVRDSLYSVCFFVPNITAQKMLLSLMQRPVSVKKHALRIHHLVCDLQTQQEFLLHLTELENHITTRTVLLQYAIDCLADAKTVSMFYVVKEMLKRLTPDDRQIILLLTTSTVPGPFMEEYLQLLLEKSKLLKEVINIAFVSKILGVIGSHVSVISEQFVERLIEEYFLSELFFESISSHQAVSDLFVKYLKGIQPSRTAGRNLITSDLSHRQECLKKRLASNTKGKTVEVLKEKDRHFKGFANGTLGNYPVRNMLITFIQSFCSECLQQELKKDTDLCLFIDILLSFLAQFDQHIMFSPYVFLSLTRIFRTHPEEGPNVSKVGEAIGNFCDLITTKSPELSHYILPRTVKEFFQEHSFGIKSDVRNRIMMAMIPSSPVDSALSLLRLMVVANCLPSQWQTDAEYEDFRKLFIPLARNTPVESFLFMTIDYPGTEY